MPKEMLDEIDHQILDILIENTRTPFTDIAKKLFVSAGTVHVRVKKMEDLGLIKGSSLILDYEKLGNSFVAYIGIFLSKTNQINFVIERLVEIPNITNVHISTGKFNLYCKLRAKNKSHAKKIIFQIDDIQGVDRTETMISLEESFNDKNRLMHQIFNEL
ncbi:MAG: Lrp/AsnC family transcriptional regulator [Maribacter sp.]